MSHQLLSFTFCKRITLRKVTYNFALQSLWYNLIQEIHNYKSKVALAVMIFILNFMKIRHFFKRF